jgi:hypothetical protein
MTRWVVFHMEQIAVVHAQHDESAAKSPALLDRQDHVTPKARKAAGHCRKT